MIIDLIINGNLVEAKEFIFNRLNEIAAKRGEELKRYVAEDIGNFEEQLDESSNIIKMGRIKKIRRRIRRNKKGKIIVQRNVKRSAIKGYRVSGNVVKRIPTIKRLQKARKLKRFWKTKGKARLKRTLFKRKQSMRRRKSMGIK